MLEDINFYTYKNILDFIVIKWNICIDTVISKKYEIKIY